MFLLNGNPLPIDTQFEVNGTTYPQNWLRLTSIEEKNAIGITEVADPEPYDDRFYWGVDNPKDLDGLKAQWTSQAKDTAQKLLAQTDWMYIRRLERGVDVPTDVVEYRAAVIGEVNRFKTAIEQASDVPSLVAIVTTQGWPDNQ